MLSESGRSEQSSGAGEFAVFGVRLVGVRLSCVVCGGVGSGCVGNGLRGRRLGRATRGVGWRACVVVGVLLGIELGRYVNKWV